MVSKGNHPQMVLIQVSVFLFYPEFLAIIHWKCVHLHQYTWAAIQHPVPRLYKIVNDWTNDLVIYNIIL